MWDSRTTEEFREVRQKAQFLIHPPADFRLVETFLLTTEREFRFLSDHLRRLAASARYFGYRFRRESVLSALHCAVDLRGADGIGPKKVRLLLGKTGDVSVEVSPLRGPQTAVGTTPLRVTLSDVAVSSRDPFVRHKTTNRALRDEELRKAREAGCDEVLFLNERGELTEGAITNLFVEISGRLYTPPAECGLLEGVFRRQLLKGGSMRASEKVLSPGDLGRADRIFLTNSVRGLLPARLAGRITGSLAG